MSDSLKKRAIRSFALFYHEGPEKIAHGRSFVMSDLKIHSWLLFWHVRPELFAHSRSFDLNDLSKGANERWVNERWGNERILNPDQKPTGKTLASLLVSTFFSDQPKADRERDHLNWLAQFFLTNQKPTGKRTSISIGWQKHFLGTFMCCPWNVILIAWGLIYTMFHFVLGSALSSPLSRTNPQRRHIVVNIFKFGIWEI